MIKGSELFDRIILDDLSKLEKLGEWYNGVRNDISIEGCVPMDCGIIEYKWIGEDAECVFERLHDDIFHIELWSQFKDSHIMLGDFDYDIVNIATSNFEFSDFVKSKMKSGNPAIMSFAMSFKNVIRESAMVFRTVMYGMAFAKNVIKSDKAQETKLTRHEAKKVRRTKDKPLKLIKNVYIYDDSVKLPKPKKKRKEPDHEFPVRGTMRHLKSGKVVPVKPFTKYKNKGNKKVRTYEL